MPDNIYQFNNVWFTSDLHLWHNDIIQMCNRPYNDVDEMWLDVKTKWNHQVQDDDTVFILGDFIWKKSKQVCQRTLSQLNGKKILVLGNHDREKSLYKEGFEYIDKIIDIQVISDKTYNLVLCHYPMISWNGMHRGSIQLFGHCHGNLPIDVMYDKQIDIGWDIKHDLFSFNDIKNKFYE
jgi:calcineurin-like phosphoesterase family protein